MTRSSSIRNVLQSLTALSLIVGLGAAATKASAAQPQSGRRIIYCVGMRGAVGYSQVEATCFGWDKRRTYRLSLKGVGFAFYVPTGTAFRMFVDYPQERYDKEFDPIPGDYYASMRGFALGPGWGEITGSAGNKTIHAISINGGIGVDRGLVALLRIW